MGQDSVVGLQLNLGSGNTLPKGWTNIDNSWHARLAKIPWCKHLLLSLGLLPKHYKQITWQGEVQFHDLTKPMPYADNSVSVIYASHVVEHLFFKDAQRLLQECYRVLQPAGVIRIIVPDLDALVSEYLGHKNSAGDMRLANQRFVNNLYMVPEETNIPWWIRWFRGYHDKNLHRWVYNQQQLQQLLEAAGFSEVKKCGCFESKIATIREVEQPERLTEALCLEACKKA